jgi:hypothetical protein
VYRSRIQTFVQRENELKENNIKLRETILNTERSSHDTVAVNLRRFDQYKVLKLLYSIKKMILFILENHFTC